MTVQPPLQALVPQVGSLSQVPAACGYMRDLLLDQRVNPDVRVKVEGPSGREGLLGRSSRPGEKVPGEVTGGLVMNAVGKAPGASREETDVGGYRPGLKGPQKKGVFVRITCLQRREGAARQPQVVDASSQSGQPIALPAAHPLKGWPPVGRESERKVVVGVGSAPGGETGIAWVASP